MNIDSIYWVPILGLIKAVDEDLYIADNRIATWWSIYQTTCIFVACTAFVVGFHFLSKI